MTFNDKICDEFGQQYYHIITSFIKLNRNPHCKFKIEAYLIYWFNVDEWKSKDSFKLAVIAYWFFLSDLLTYGTTGISPNVVCSKCITHTITFKIQNHNDGKNKWRTHATSVLNSHFPFLINIKWPRWYTYELFHLIELFMNTKILNYLFQFNIFTC